MFIVSTEKLPEECKKLISVKDENLSEEDLKKAEIIMLWPKQAVEILPKAKNVKVIQTFSAGVDDFPFNLLPKGVVLLSNAGAYSKSVAEHVFALILSLARGVGKRDRNFEVRSIFNSTFLILGGGGIGSEVARIGKKAFFTYNIGISRHFKEEKYFDEKYYSLKALKEIVPRVDVIVDTLPLNNETRGALNYEVLKNVKHGVIIVNVGRAETIVEDDIYRLLLERKDVRFGTDVFWRKNGKEEFNNNKLWELENFIGTPHIAGAGGNKKVREEALMAACKNVSDYLKGEVKNMVRIEDYVSQ